MNNSSITFPPLALGTWTFAGDAIWSETSEQESIRVIHAAIDKGITLFDTSPNYGSGRSIRSGTAGGRRQSRYVPEKSKGTLYTHLGILIQKKPL